MKLNPRTQRALTRTISAAALFGGVSTIAWALFFPPQQSWRDWNLPNGPLPEADPNVKARIELSDFADAWTRRLQRPLVDPPPVEAKGPEPTLAAKEERPARPPATAPAVTLKSILFSEDRRLAVFHGADGKDIICAVGESVGDATVKMINSTQVVLEKEAIEFPYSIAPTIVK